MKTLTCFIASASCSPKQANWLMAELCSSTAVGEWLGLQTSSISASVAAKTTGEGVAVVAVVVVINLSGLMAPLQVEARRVVEVLPMPTYQRSTRKAFCFISLATTEMGC